jgi:hypothetical protein
VQPHSWLSSPNQLWSTPYLPIALSLTQKQKPNYSALVKLYRNAENDLLKPYAPARMAAWRIACQRSFGGYSSPFVQHQTQPCPSLYPSILGHRNKEKQIYKCKYPPRWLNVLEIRPYGD